MRYLFHAQNKKELGRKGFTMKQNELLKALESLKLDEELQKKLLEKSPKNRFELVRLATQLGIELDFDAVVELDDSEAAKVCGGVKQDNEDILNSNGY